MRLVFADPLEELKQAIQDARANPSVSHIAITAGELRSCLQHGKAGEVLPSYINVRQNQINQFEMRLKQLKPMLAGNTLTPEQKQNLFDRQDNIEEMRDKVKNELPSSITEDGILIKVSLR